MTQYNEKNSGFGKNTRLLHKRQSLNTKMLSTCDGSVADLGQTTGSSVLGTATKDSYTFFQTNLSPYPRNIDRYRNPTSRNTISESNRKMSTLDSNPLRPVCHREVY
jgi:hypothetical protein